MSRTNAGRHERPHTSLNTTRIYPDTHLLGLPYDIRRIIYDSHYPVGKYVHLTFGETTRSLHPGMEEPTRYRIDPDGVNLMRVCRQVNDEVSAMIYGKNTFFMVPGEHLAISWLNLRDSTSWLHQLRLPTQQLVKVDIHIELPLDKTDTLWLTYGLAQLSRVEITIGSMSSWRPKARLDQSKSLIEFVREIMNARGPLPTIWNDKGDPQNETIFKIAGIRNVRSGAPVLPSTGLTSRASSRGRKVESRDKNAT